MGGWGNKDSLNGGMGKHRKLKWGGGALPPWKFFLQAIFYKSLRVSLIIFRYWIKVIMVPIRILLF